MNVVPHTLFLLLVILFQLPGVGYAQEHNYTQYTIEDGLPTNYVYGLVEDNRGYIWAYTEQGIARFDGYEWKAFGLNDGLGTLDCYSMCPLLDGSFLVGGKGWPSIVDGDSIFKLPLPSNISETNIKNSYIREGYPPWIGFEEGLSNPFSRTLLVSSADSSLLYSLKPNVFFQGSDARVFDSDEQRSHVESQIHEKVEFLTANSIFVGSVDKHKFAFWKSPSHYFLNGEIEGSLDRNRYGSFRGLVSDQKLQAHVDSTFFQFDSTFRKLAETVDLSLWYSFYDINRVFRARNGDLWLATRSSGLIHISSKFQKVKILSENVGRINSIEGVTSTREGVFVADDKSRLYKIEGGKLVSLNLENKVKNDSRFKFLRQSKDGEILFKRGRKVLSISGRDVMLAEVFGGRTYEQIGQCFSDQFGWDELEYRKAVSSLTSQAVVVCKDFTLVEDDITLIRINGDSCHGVRSSMAFAYEKRSLINEKEIFITNKSELFKVSSTRFDTIWSADTLLLTALYSLDESTFLLGTQSNGVFRLALGKETKLVNLFSSKRVKAITRDASGRFWAATFSGAFRFTETGEVDLHLSQLNGLPSSETYDIDFFSDSVALGTAKGVALFAQDIEFDLEPKISGRYVELTNVRVNGESFQYNGLHIELGPEENDLEIGFSLVHPGSNGNISYEIQLEEYDRKPIRQTNRSVRYTQLDAGDYSFTVTATAKDGSQYSLEQPLHIHLRAHIYNQSWFQLLCLFLGASGIWLFMRFREQERFRVASERLNNSRRNSELQLEALRSQMNPHFVFNALGSIQYYIQSEEKDLADNYLTKFAQLMRKYLDSSKRNLVTVGEEVALLTQYMDLEKLRFDHGFTYEINIGDEVDDSDPLPSMILQPFVENAIIHGLANRPTVGGKITISIVDDNNATVVVISDNGIGLENSKKLKRRGHRSRATEITNERISVLRNSGYAEIDLTYDVLDPTDIDCPGTSATLRIDFHSDGNKKHDW
ncbi:MAG: sensor histidine kinase [Saprospiraceae bacterium]